MALKRILVGAGALAAAVVLMAACGDDDNEGGPKSQSSSSTGSPAAEGTRQSATATSPASANVAGAFRDLLKDREKKTFLVAYAFDLSATQKGTYTIAQKPPKSASIIDLPGTTVTEINDGKDTYACTKLGASGTCQKTGAGGGGLAGRAFVDPSAVLSAAERSSDIKEVAGRTVAGREARCFEYTPTGSSASVVCIDKKDGLLLVVEGKGPDAFNLVATEVKTSVDDKVFELPYKVQ